MQVVRINNFKFKSSQSKSIIVPDSYQSSLEKIDSQGKNYLEVFDKLLSLLKISNQGIRENILIEKINLDIKRFNKSKSD